MTNKKHNYFKKTISFQGTELVMFSIDGDTWSTRKDELHAIIERHEFEKENFGGQIKGGPQVKSKQPPTAVVPEVEATKAPIKTIAKKGVAVKEKYSKEKKKIKATTKLKAKLPEPKKRLQAKGKAGKVSKPKRRAA